MDLVSSKSTISTQKILIQARPKAMDRFGEKNKQIQRRAATDRLVSYMKNEKLEYARS